MNRHQMITGIFASALTVAAAFVPTSAQPQQSQASHNSRAASPTQLSADNKLERTVTIAAARGVAVHRFELELPAGASLQALPSEQGESELVSEIQVVDRDGNVMGVVDSPWAQDASGNSLFTFFRIEGNTVVQTIDTSDAGQRPVTATLMYSGSRVDPDAEFLDGAADSGEIGIQAVSFVTVPSNYVYNPSLGSLHDYCTASPDEFPNPVGPNANFRGPCARHDLCYAGTTSAFTCDTNLRENMRINCRYTYAWWDPTRAACYTTADIYFAAVVLHTGG